MLINSQGQPKRCGVRPTTNLLSRLLRREAHEEIVRFDVAMDEAALMEVLKKRDQLHVRDGFRLHLINKHQNSFQRKFPLAAVEAIFKTSREKNKCKSPWSQQIHHHDVIGPFRSVPPTPWLKQ
jgi:hypothetical protein